LWFPSWRLAKSRHRRSAGERQLDHVWVLTSILFHRDFDGRNAVNRDEMDEGRYDNSEKGYSRVVWVDYGVHLGWHESEANDQLCSDIRVSKADLL
jgi:hypothetical protein